ncbi:restriction endonuclease [Paludibacterium purpuratum]|uniref:Restriction endonuclease n=1 Tax=Paludibacterium purpuratum TaxID=1144873 RepID=A0A4R7BGW4_9NEIS|nr:restriction endonuclease [Paludibacterium purpuratum]TDR82997.1 restriction endonuclease [Paludibacterium purpuratum]
MAHLTSAAQQASNLLSRFSFMQVAVEGHRTASCLLQSVRYSGLLLRQKLRQTTGGNSPARPLQWSQLKPTRLVENRAVHGFLIPCSLKSCKEGGIANIKHEIPIGDMMTIRTLTDLSPSEFENLTLDLLARLGLKNSVWRTPGRDGGRDIQGDEFMDDFSGYTSQKSWYVDCKRYSGTVSWPTVWEKIAFADSNNADVFLLVTTSTLSPQAVDEVNRWNDTRRAPSIRFWNGHDFDHRLSLHTDIQVKYGLSSQPIQDAAPAIVELSKILLKYTNSIAAQVEFGRTTEGPLAAIQAISELITARLGEIELTGHISVQRFRAEVDAYEWLKDAESISLLGFDRFAVRAIAALIRCYSKATDMVVARIEDSPNAVEIRGQGIPETLLSDLTTIGFWGSIGVKLTPELVILERMNAAS